MRIALASLVLLAPAVARADDDLNDRAPATKPPADETEIPLPPPPTDDAGPTVSDETAHGRVGAGDDQGALRPHFQPYMLRPIERVNMPPDAPFRDEDALARRRLPRSERAWYGLSIMVLDALAAGALYLGVTNPSTELTATGVALYWLGAPIDHAVHGNGSSTLASLSLRAGLPLVTLFFADQTGPYGGLVAHGGGAPSATSPLDGRVAIAIGAAIACIADWTLLAYREVPLRRSREEARPHRFLVLPGMELDSARAPAPTLRAAGVF
jgi:hypothetical protein